MKYFLTIALALFAGAAQAQMPFRQEFDTDSSHIEIIRNSVYRVYEETYNYRDSVWYNVTYIDDTSRLHTEGWRRKDGKHLGVWKEYNRKGELMYTWDHERGSCRVNESLYPHHQLLQRMKATADGFIVSAYGTDFTDRHVRFNYNCYAYRGHRGKFGRDTMWIEDYVGSWTEPLKAKPNSYLFRYEARLHPTDRDYIELGICLDSNGRYVPSIDDAWNNYGFEQVSGKRKKFVLTRDGAIEAAKTQGLSITDSSEISEFLTWENDKKQAFYNGRFRYYIAALRAKEPYEKQSGRKGIIFRYNVYCFNPWTGAFIEAKKMKSRREWGQLSGHSTGLMADDD